MKKNLRQSIEIKDQQTQVSVDASIMLKERDPIKLSLLGQGYLKIDPYLKRFAIAAPGPAQPHAPLNFSVIVSYDPTIAGCTWTAVSGVDGYNVYLKSNGVFVKQNSVLITDTTYDIEGLEDGNYEAYAKSVLNDVESDASNTKAFEIDTGVSVAFVDASLLDIVASDTTTTVAIPNDVQEDDYLVLHVVHRSALTAPAGWTVLEGPTADVLVANQMQTVLYRVAETGDGGTNVTSTQASSGRMLSHIQAFRSEGIISVIASEITQSTDTGLNLPQLTATDDGQMAVVSMSNVFAETSGNTTLTPPSGYTGTTPEAAEQLRLGCAYKTMNNTDQISGRFSGLTTDTDRTAFSLILGVDSVTYDHYTDFSEYTADQAPSDWTRRWDTTGSGWLVKAQVGATGGKILEFQDHSTTVARRAISWDELDIPDTTDVEITMRFKGLISGTDNDQSDPRVLTRGSYPSSNENGYTHGYRWGTNNLRLNAYKNGSFNDISSIAQTNDLNEWYIAKIRVEGNDHKVKVWKDGDTEPDWQNEATDNSSPITADGWIGLFSFGYREYEIDWFGVNELGGT